VTGHAIGALVLLAGAAAGCRTPAAPPDVLWAREDAPRVWEDVVGGRDFSGMFIGGTDGVMFYATRCRERAFTGPTWDDEDVVAFARTGRKKRLGKYVYWEYELQGGIDANEQVRDAARQMRRMWPGD